MQSNAEQRAFTCRRGSCALLTGRQRALRHRRRWRKSWARCLHDQDEWGGWVGRMSQRQWGGWVRNSEEDEWGTVRRTSEEDEWGTVWDDSHAIINSNSYNTIIWTVMTHYSYLVRASRTCRSIHSTTHRIIATPAGRVFRPPPRSTSARSRMSQTV